MATVLNPEINISYKERDINHYFRKKNDLYSNVINSFMHTAVPAESFDHIKPSIVSSLILHDTKNFVISLSKFNDLCSIFPEYNYEVLKEKFIKVLSFISELSPENFSFSLTNEYSVFFIFRISDYEIHLNYYFEYDKYDIDDDEVVFTYYKNEEKQESFGGNLKDAIYELKSIVNEEINLPIFYFSQSL